MSIITKSLQVDGEVFNFTIDTDKEQIVNDREFTKLAQHVNRIIMNAIYQRFTVYIPGLDAEDLKQELLLLTWRAVLRYDSTKGCKFSSYILNMADNRIKDMCNKYGKLHYIKKYKDTKPELAHVAISLLNAHYLDEYMEEHGHEAPELGIEPQYAFMTSEE